MSVLVVVVSRYYKYKVLLSEIVLYIRQYVVTKMDQHDLVLPNPSWIKMAQL